MKEKEFILLVTKYLSAEISESESTKLQQELSDPAKQKQYDFIRKKWEDAVDHYVPKFSYDRGYQLLVDKISRHEPLQVRKNFTQKNVNAINLYSYLRSIAAVGLIAAFIYIFYLILPNKFWNAPSDYQLRKKTTIAGQKANINLDDATKITMNGESELQFKEPFQDNFREFDLAGEAYFEVTRNPKAPFVVNFKGLKVEVLGTKFNIEADSNDPISNISLVEGSIKVKDEENREVKILKPGEQMSYNHQTGKLIVHSFDMIKTIGWKDNILVFNNEKIKDILPDLTRQYGVTFQVENQKILACVVKANFQNEPLYAVLEALKFAADFEYEITNNNVVVLTGSGCP